MGSITTSPALKKEMPIKPVLPEPEAEATVTISRLDNSIYYFIELVYIAKQKGCFRLIAIHHNRVLCDRLYQGLAGARIAFGKLYGHKRWDPKAKPVWSHFYAPASDWYRRSHPAASLQIPSRRGEL
jgi:hypothetical protein